MIDILVDSKNLAKDSLFLKNISRLGIKVCSNNTSNKFAIVLCSSKEESIESKFIPNTLCIFIGKENIFSDLVLNNIDDFPSFNSIDELESVFFELVYKQLKESDFGLLCDKALEVQKNSRNTYSHFSVGASVLSSGKNIYVGTNVENSSYGATICAERSAVMAGVANEGKNFSIEKLVVATPTEWPGSPCGICLQVISDLAKSSETIILLIGKDGKKAIRYSIVNLLPRAFSL